MTNDQQPIVFLDVDGVLNNNTYIKNQDYSAWGLWQNDEEYKDLMGGIRRSQIMVEKVELFADFVRVVNAEVVLSTTWRVDSLERGILCESLAKEDIVPIGDTPITSRYQRIPRGLEIARWLQVAGITKRPFVVFDDMSPAGMVGRYRNHIGFVMDRFIRTSDNEGLTEADVHEAILLLEEQASWGPYELPEGTWTGDV